MSIRHGKSFRGHHLCPVRKSTVSSAIRNSLCAGVECYVLYIFLQRFQLRQEKIELNHPLNVFIRYRRVLAVIVIVILSEDTPRLCSVSDEKVNAMDLAGTLGAYFKLLCLYVVPFLAYLTELQLWNEN